MEDFFKELEIIKPTNDLRTYSPLTLAYIGDCVFDMCVRTYVLKNGNTTSNKLHNYSKKYVNATSQSKMYKYIKDKVLEQELTILKRGRNANSHSSAKNSSLIDYKNATGLEALFGYLYLKGDFKRIIQIFKLCLTAMEEGDI